RTAAPVLSRPDRATESPARAHRPVARTRTRDLRRGRAVDRGSAWPVTGCLQPRFGPDHRARRRPSDSVVGRTRGEPDRVRRPGSRALVRDPRRAGLIAPTNGYVRYR